MLRRLFTLFFIIASLTPQAGIAFSCAMMIGPPQQHCCCDPDELVPAEPGGSEEASCCQVVVQIADGPGDQIGGLHASSKLPDYNPQILPPVLAPVLLSLKSSTRVDVLAWDASQDNGPPGTDLYLHTQRLRL